MWDIIPGLIKLLSTHFEARGRENWLEKA